MVWQPRTQNVIYNGDMVSWCRCHNLWVLWPKSSRSERWVEKEKICITNPQDLAKPWLWHGENPMHANAWQVKHATHVIAAIDGMLNCRECLSFWAAIIDNTSKSCHRRPSSTTHPKAVIVGHRRHHHVNHPRVLLKPTSSTIATERFLEGADGGVFASGSFPLTP
ncbi:hypothetical protein HHK36_006678 [Tetracentron sinense]|uniref:Uncharacterized protein n=1 Tax=Tetracentron sinense TaxID=13715 RepID=A0A834ZHW7_TETSI|nr:hypothetical protein HHK36_006678 [Tetracentron sinense]